MLARLVGLAVLVVLVQASYVDVYVDSGPDVEGLHIYAWDGQRWAPVEVVYVPVFVETYVVAAGEWAPSPYYNASRYVLRLPAKALAVRGGADPPRGFERWRLEVDNGTRRVVVDLAVGRGPMKENNVTHPTWVALGSEEAKTPNRGRLDKPAPPPRRPSSTGGEVGIAAYAVSTGMTVYPVGSLYFKPISVVGTFSQYFPVDSPTGHTLICADNMHFVGYEVQNFTIGVHVKGYVTSGYLTLEFYDIVACSVITTATLSLPSSGSRWTDLQVNLPQDRQIGLRVRASGRAELAEIKVNIVARYKKVVNSPTQVATSKAMNRDTVVSFSAGKPKIAVLFGPYVAYDGLAATQSGLSYSYVRVPSHTVSIKWYSSLCPSFIAIEYYVNQFFYTSVWAPARTSTPQQYTCTYDVPAVSLQIRAREYSVSKAVSGGGGISVSLVYSLAYNGGGISYSGNLEIMFDRWIEPFHSRYYLYDKSGPSLEWGHMLLYDTVQVLGPANTTNKNVVAEIRADNNQLVLTFAHNWEALCSVHWKIEGLDVSDNVGVYYGDEAYQEPWWAEVARRVLDAIDWISTVTGSSGPDWKSFGLKVVQNIFSAGGASTKRDGNAVEIRWIKPVYDPTPPKITLKVDLLKGSSFKWYWVGYSIPVGDICIPVLIEVNTNVDLTTNAFSTDVVPPRAKIWTWRGQTYLGTSVTNVR